MKFAKWDDLTLSGGGFSNPRTRPEPEKVKELAESLLQRGFETPLKVWVSPDKELVIIGGSRRYTAIEYLIDTDQAGELQDKIPYQIFKGTLSEARMEAFFDNLHREDLTSFEMASTIFSLTEEGVDQKEIATRLGKSQSWVSILLTSYKQSGKALKKAWAGNKLPLDTVYKLSSVEDEAAQAAAVDEQLAARAGGSREGAGDATRAAKRAAGKSDCPSKKQVQSYRDLAEGSDDKYVLGMFDALRFVLGEIGVGEFEKPWFKWMDTRQEVANEADGEDELETE